MKLIEAIGASGLKAAVNGDGTIIVDKVIDTPLMECYKEENSRWPKHPYRFRAYVGATDGADWQPLPADFKFDEP